MPAPPTQLHRFLTALHRRLLIVRGLERIGLCALVGCAAALVLMPILLLRGQTALPVALAAPAGGGLVGLLWALARRPTRLQTAIEADRQLRLHDLLSTALAITQAPHPDPWTQSVLAMAEQRSATLLPHQVVLNRWGARAWGGLGLAAAFVLTLGFLSSNAPPSQATTETTPSIRPDQLSSSVLPPPSGPLTSPDGKDTRQFHSNGPDETSGNSSRSAEPPPSPPDATATASSSAPHPGPGQSGAGGGAARTHDSQGHSTLTASGGSPSKPTTPGAGLAGSGVPQQNATGNVATPGPAGTTVGQLAPAPVPSPSPLRSWAQARHDAMDAVRDGRVPDDYHDLIEKYFQDR